MLSLMRKTGCRYLLLFPRKSRDSHRLFFALNNSKNADNSKSIVDIKWIISLFDTTFYSAFKNIIFIPEVSLPVKLKKLVLKPEVLSKWFSWWTPSETYRIYCKRPEADISYRFREKAGTDRQTDRQTDGRTDGQGKTIERNFLICRFLSNTRLDVYLFYINGFQLYSIKYNLYLYIDIETNTASKIHI